jgi:ABC-2 type transport system ATP-binding protein
VTPPSLRLDGASKWYGQVLALNGANLELGTGIHGLVGANGAGKTTLLRIASGLILPDEGSASILGVSTRKTQARSLVGYAPETDSFYEEYTTLGFLVTMARIHGFSKNEAIRRAELSLDQVGLSNQSEKRIKGCSRGMRQRVKLAQALLHDPPLLILDEPFSGVDPVVRQDLVELFRKMAKGGRTLLFSSHELDEVERLTENILVLVRGRIVAVGSAGEVRKRLDNHPCRVALEWPDTPDQPSLSALLGEWANWPEISGWERLNTIPGRVGCLIRAAREADFLTRLQSQVLQWNWTLERVENLDGSTRALVGRILGGKIMGSTS